LRKTSCMSWLYEKFILPSDKNKAIRCTRFFGSWEVVGDGFFQSSDYVTRMWARALRRVPREGIKNILVLGLGGGGCIKPLRRRYPRARIVAIEWDEAMVRVADRIKIYGQRPEIILGDANEVLDGLSGKFDLILGDIFQGAEPLAEFHDVTFMRKFARALEPRGFFILNCYRTPKIFEAAGKVFGCHARWRFRLNRLALFRWPGNGALGDAQPADYRHYLSSATYLKREETDGFYTRVGTAENPGLRWHYGPFWIESHQTDVEPIIQPFGHARLVIWQRVVSADKPKGWLVSPAQMNHRLTGFAKVAPEYWLAWSEHAQRHRKKWLATQPYEIEEGSVGEYLAAYAKSSKDPLLKRLIAGLIKKKVARHGARVKFFRARDGTRTVAGLVCLEIPEDAYAYHLASFVLPEAERSSVAVGLMDFWFSHAAMHGFKYLELDNFWSPGNPKNWRGFSRFKAQFGVRFVRYPQPLLKIVASSK